MTRQPARPLVWPPLTSPVSFGRFVCRDRFSTAARIGIAVASFVVIFAILLAYTMYRRRKTAQANMAFVHAPQNQQQGYPDQYPPPPQGGFSGTPPGANGQKAQQGYDAQPYNGQYNPQYNGQYNPQYNGQYNPPYNAPQYPPATYDQGQQVSVINCLYSPLLILVSQAPPYPGYGPPPGPPPQQPGNPHNV